MGNPSDYETMFSLLYTGKLLMRTILFLFS